MTHGRDYQGRPLDFFRTQYAQKPISRWELSQEDMGLYRALLRHHQLDEAIPDLKSGYQKGHAGKRGPPKEVIEKIIKAHGQYDSARKAAENLPVCHKTVIKVWDQNKLPLLHRRRNNGRRAIQV